MELAGVYRRLADLIAATADVRIDGDRPWDIRVRDPGVFRRALLGGSIGLGEAYLDGQWWSQDLEETAYRFAAARLEEVATLLPAGISQRVLWALGNQQSRQRSQRVARQHYDLGNDLFFAFLGAKKNYSCGSFRDATDLDSAQLGKLDLLCRKLNLQPGQRLLDVGGGWGEFARHAAQHHGARVTSISISNEQVEFAREYCKGTNVEVLRCDYRDVRGRFDRIAAIAMFTHVGFRNYRTFMQRMHELLEPDGIFVMEGIWGNVSTVHIDAWMDKYIFPGGQLPSGKQTFEAVEGLFVVEDLHNFGPSYVETLRAWHRNLEARWPELSTRYDDRVRRIFEYYFQVCAGYFRARAIQNWQLVLTKPGRSQPDCRLY
jgi:cyclopropane-fatty-acyl-phospholipid synthase